MSELSHPAGVMARLEDIDRQLALAQNAIVDAASGWFKDGKPAREVAEAEAYAAATGTVPERKFAADAAGALVGCEQEARWEGMVRFVRVLETRSTIGQSLLKAMGRS